MDQNLKDQVLDNLTKAENILIVVAKPLGFDGLAAGLALYLSLIKLDKNVSIIAQAPTVGDAQSLYAVDAIGKGGGARNPVVVIEDAVETVDHVTYFLDKTKLKVVIHPLPGTREIPENRISVEYVAAPANLIFAIGVDNLHDLRSEFTREQEINPEAWIININNKEPSQKFAQIDVVNTHAAGVSEVTAKMLQDMALPVDEDVAFNLYGGIRASTNNFSPNLVSPMSFEIASWLLKFGAGKASLARQANAVESHQTIQTSAQEAQGKPPYEPYPQPQPFLTQQQDEESEDFFEKVIAPEEVETQPQQPKETPKSGDWLKPPKIYKGSKSFDREN
jgi:hypothetical protein